MRSRRPGGVGQADGEPDRDDDARSQRDGDPLCRLRLGGAARRRRGQHRRARRRARRSSGSASTAAPRSRSLPQPVPHYTTLRELGRGAMGVVYQARHNQTGQLVALKLIVPETAATRSAVDRFLREMSVISQLKHPNIVELLEQGMTRGQFWFAMEYVLGGTNLEVLAQAEPGTLPDPQGLPDGLPGAQGAGAGAQARVRAPRHQAREHPDRPPARRPDREDLRLRPGQELPGPRALEHDLLGRDAGDGPVHAAGADARLQDGAPLGRPLRHRRHALLPAHLPVHLRPGGRWRRPDPCAPRRAPRPDPEAPQPTSPPAWPGSWRSASPASPTTAIPPPPRCARHCGRSARSDRLQLCRRGHGRPSRRGRSRGA